MSDESFWRHFPTAYRSDAGGWCVRIGRAYFHVTGVLKWRRVA